MYKRADRGWIILAAYVVGHNVRAAGRGDEMLSQATARYSQAHPVIVRAIIAVTAMHLAKLLPRRVDPYATLFEGVGVLLRKFQ